VQCSVVYDSVVWCILVLLATCSQSLPKDHTALIQLWAFAFINTTISLIMYAQLTSACLPLSSSERSAAPSSSYMRQSRDTSFTLPGHVIRYATALSLSFFLSFLSFLKYFQNTFFTFNILKFSTHCSSSYFFFFIFFFFFFVSASLIIDIFLTYSTVF
jgi:hypothetical protein